MPDQLAELTKLIIKFRAERDWQQFHSAKDLAISLTLEAAEVAEIFQWRTEAEVKAYLKTHTEELGDELSDVLYWVLTIAHDFNINLDTAFKQKMKKNALKYPIEKSKGKHTKYTKLHS